MEKYYLNKIKKFRNLALEPKITYLENRYYFAKRYCENENLIYPELRYADAYKYMLENVSINIDIGELILGKPSNGITEAQLEELNEIYPKVINIMENHGQDSHMTVDYELLLTLGTSGIKKKIEKYEKETKEESKLLFYKSARICLEAMEIYAKRHSQKALELSEKAEGREKEELIGLAEILSKVPMNPAESFYEAIESVVFLTFTLSFNPSKSNSFQQYQLGRPDRYLYEYYKKDLSENKITPEFAQVLMDFMAININRRIPRGLSSGYMLGGRREDGSIVQNELTLMGMKAIRDVKLVYPSVGLCYVSDMDDIYLKTACEILSEGHSHPAIFGDDTITKGLEFYGCKGKNKTEYIHSTCVEITPIASSNVWVASPYTNLPQLLLDVIYENEIESFEDLLAKYFDKLDKRIENNLKEQNELRKIRENKALFPLLSCFVDDCLEKGLDIERGGARFNWIMPSFVGTGNLADALNVIRELVFIKKKYSLKEIKTMLEANFVGFEKEYNEILNTVPKYGNDNDEVDSLVTLITEHIVKECEKHVTYYNSRLVPSVFCWEKHAYFGKETMATPDGRLKGFPLGDGSGPCQGREKCGPTASILSATKWSHKEFIGGVAVNMKFSKQLLSPDAIENIMTLIKVYIERGGFEMQINVVDKETLIKAQKTPELYKDLVVRIGGYSDYFVHLSKEMQAEVIMRTQHEI
ncbi:MAG: hypothetical protein E7564_05700 [Ruminococcaceae bacterium]|nr:hypothetical protein [Oscillospiraceae bacterium]